VLELQLRGITLVTERDFELFMLTRYGVDRALAQHTGARAVRLTGVDALGAPLSTALKNEILAALPAYSMVNITYTMNDPAYTTVAVTYTVKAYPGYDAAALEAAIDAQLASILSPGNWGRPRAIGDTDPTRWYLENRVRVNKLIDLVGNVDGVDYVTSLTLAAVGRTGVTGVAATDVITLTGHGFADTQRVKFSAITGGAGLSAGTTYFVRDATADTFKLAATSGGAAINFTTDITAGTLAPDVETNGDLILPGSVALPAPGTMTGTIT
jgi:hypothetical protein